MSGARIERELSIAALKSPAPDAEPNVITPAAVAAIKRGLSVRDLSSGSAGADIADDTLSAQPIGATSVTLVDMNASSALARRFDARILAPLTILYLLCYLDRSNLANAKTPISAALSLSTSQYALASSIFQVGYIFFEVPANYVLTLSRPSIWLGFLVAAFGAVAAATAAVTNYEGLLTLRIALGIAEAGFPPGVLYVLSQWYPPAELGTRNALFLVAGPLANAFGAVIAYGLLQLSAPGASGWQLLFLLEGLPAVVLGVVCVFALPDSIASATWLSADEKALALARMEGVGASSGGGGGGGTHHFVWTDVRALLLSPLTWAFALLNVSTNIASYGIGAFLPDIIREMGYSSLDANLRTAPIYLWTAVFNIIAAVLSDRLRERGWVIVACLAASATGMTLLALSLQLGWPLGVQYALCFTLVFYSATSPLMIAWLVKAYRGSSDAAIGPALILTIGSLGAFAGPNIYGATPEGASYARGHFIMAGVFAAGAVLALCMRLALIERPSDGRLVARWSAEARGGGADAPTEKSTLLG